MAALAVARLLPLLRTARGRRIRAWLGPTSRRALGRSRMKALSFCGGLLQLLGCVDFAEVCACVKRGASLADLLLGRILGRRCVAGLLDCGADCGRWLPASGATARREKMLKKDYWPESYRVPSGLRRATQFYPFAGRMLVLIQARGAASRLIEPSVSARVRWRRRPRIPDRLRVGSGQPEYGSGMWFQRPRPIQIHRAVVPLQNLIGLRQADAAAVFLGREIKFEDFVVHILRDSAALVANLGDNTCSSRRAEIVSSPPAASPERR